MSWWDTSQFTNIASNALKSAQKKIDHVLDIKDEELNATQRRAPSSTSAKKNVMKKSGTGEEFWNAWLDPSARPTPAPAADEPAKTEKKRIKSGESGTGKAVEARPKKSSSSSRKSLDEDDSTSWAMGASGMGGAGWGTWSISSLSFRADGDEQKKSEGRKSGKDKPRKSSKTMLNLDTEHTVDKDLAVKQWVETGKPVREDLDPVSFGGEEFEDVALPKSPDIVDLTPKVEPFQAEVGGGVTSGSEKPGLSEASVSQVTEDKRPAEHTLEAAAVHPVPEEGTTGTLADVSLDVDDEVTTPRPADEEGHVSDNKNDEADNVGDTVQEGVEPSDGLGEATVEDVVLSVEQQKDNGDGLEEPILAEDLEPQREDAEIDNRISDVPRPDSVQPELASDETCDSHTRDTDKQQICDEVPERLCQPLTVQIDDCYGAEVVEDGAGQPVRTANMGKVMNESVVGVRPDFGAVISSAMESTGLWEDADLEVPADMLVSTTDAGPVGEVAESKVPHEAEVTVPVELVVEEREEERLKDPEVRVETSGSLPEDMTDSCDRPEEGAAEVPGPLDSSSPDSSLTKGGEILESIELPPDMQNVEETVPLLTPDVIEVDASGDSLVSSEKSEGKELVNSSDSTNSSSGKQSQDMNTSRDTETDVSTDTLKDTLEGDQDTDESDHDQEDAKTTVEGKMEESVISMTSSVSSASFVKCLLEEAMAEPETSKHEDTESHSTSSDRSSDMVKIDSGHTSGDEIDTTTSSDIEIISTPTSNGEYKIDRPFDLSPLRHALSRTVRRISPPHGHTHKRTDSNSSSSGQSKGSDLEQLSPGRDYVTKGRERTKSGGDRGRNLRLVGAHADPGDHDESEDSENNPLQSDKLLKKNTLYEDVLNEKLAETAEVLDAREKKVLELSRDMMDLREANNILRQQLQQSEDAREAEMTDLNSLTEEFTIRISESEKKLQMAYKELDNLKKQLSAAQEELLHKAEDKKSHRLLEEKDEQIHELLMEGEKLSKQQLQTNNILKKLRGREKETDSLIKTQKQKLENQDTELTHLKKVLDSKEENEKKQAEAINQLSSVVKFQEKELAKLKSDLEDAQEKNRGMQTTLDNAYRELAELHKANAAKDSKAQERALSAEMQAKEELKLTLERQVHRSKQEHATLVLQIEDLQLSLTRMERECGRREDILRQEISDLHMRLQEAEARNEELTHSVSAATRPLLRQIENLQATYGTQSSSWEKIERNLTERLSDAQCQFVECSERERIKNEKTIELSSRVTVLESQVSSLRQEKSQLMATLEMERAKLEVLEDSKNKDSVQVDIMRQNFMKEINELKKEKVLLENQLEMEKLRVETEKKKVIFAQDQLREKERQSSLARSPTPVQPRTRTSSQSSEPSAVFLPQLSQDDVFERTLMLSSSNGSKMNLYETLRQSGAANILENLQSQLKQREGEIVQLQSEISDLERTRESMARELVNLTNRNEDLEEKSQQFVDLTNSYQDLDQRYNAILQMYGEKEEQVQELKLDLQDVKEMYKIQIQELLSSR